MKEIIVDIFLTLAVVFFAVGFYRNIKDRHPNKEKDPDISSKED